MLTVGIVWTGRKSTPLKLGFCVCVCSNLYWKPSTTHTNTSRGFSEVMLRDITVIETCRPPWVYFVLYYLEMFWHFFPGTCWGGQFSKLKEDKQDLFANIQKFLGSDWICLFYIRPAEFSGQWYSVRCWCLKPVCKRGRAAALSWEV